MEPLTVEIPASEWREIVPLLVFVEPDELKVTGMLRLVADGRQRWWWASDGRRLTVMMCVWELRAGSASATD